MKRFFNESDDNFFNGDDFEELDDETLEALELEYDHDEAAFTAFISKQDLMRAFEDGMGEIELNQHLLLTAISLAEERIFWKFRSEKTQMDTIERIYHKLLEMRNTVKKEEGE